MTRATSRMIKRGDWNFVKYPLLVTYLAGQLVVFLLLLGLERVPPLSENLADGAVVLVGVAPVHERSVSLAEDHECIHRAADARVFLGNQSNIPFY